MKPLQIILPQSLTQNKLILEISKQHCIKEREKGGGGGGGQINKR